MSPQEQTTPEILPDSYSPELSSGILGSQDQTTPESEFLLYDTAPNPRLSLTYNTYTWNCPIHGETSNTVSFNVGGDQTVFCLGCLSDLLKTKLVDLNSLSTSPPIIETKENIKRYSRYELLKKDKDVPEEQV